MDNSEIAAYFDMLAKLMDIHGENSFKSKTYSVAAFNIDKLPMQLKDIPRAQLRSVKGIGNSVGNKLMEMLDTGKFPVLEEYIQKTPPGVIEMLHIKGLGPKKIHSIWKEMGIESIGELQYACHENRLTLYQGFGAKTQQNVLESIDFYIQSQGRFLYAELEEIVPQVDAYLKKVFGSEKVRITGNYRRQELVIEELEFVIQESSTAIKSKLQTAQPPELLDENKKSLLFKLKNGLRLRIYYGNSNRADALFTTTGNALFLEAFQKDFSVLNFADDGTEDDEIFFLKAGIDFVPPCMRETAAVLEMAKDGKLPVLIQPGDIRSIIHCHSTWSDGGNSPREMAEECIRRGYAYMVLSDHSQSAFYANGLKADRVIAQHKEIEALNQELAPFKIFKSIESDILNDGSLDYPSELLQTFDLIIASIHSNLKMTEEKAMARLLKAVENPFTRMLGHPTGRLLLSRNGYPVDHKILLDACAANQVVVEINAHPRRLDLDWKWVDYAMKKGVLLSINPDAHFLSGFDDVKYGVLAAQKGGLTKERNLSSYELQDFEKWLASK